MRYRKTDEYDEIAERTELVKFSSEYRIGDFDCGIKDYNDFLTNDASIYIEHCISRTYLLLDKHSYDVVGYIALLADSITLEPPEKELEGLTMPFNSFPALKIGKLATSKDHKEYHYGSFLLELAVGFAESSNESGVACRFLTVDADLEYDPDTPVFYKKNGFIPNQKYASRTKTVSMRYDILDH